MQDGGRLNLNIPPNAVDNVCNETRIPRTYSIAARSFLIMPSATSPSNPMDLDSAPFALPPPQTFDILPPLHALLGRLLPPPDSTSSAPALSPKDLATEAAAIKIKIQKARAAVQGLPDVERTIEEQQEEIRELEDKISGLKGALARIAGACHGRKGEDK
ncbi:hypothetical protein MMC20_007120 [Loxospora ochrophaea]|nr:hypothetical protein [Loxospora ochrophaea]